MLLKLCYKKASFQIGSTHFKCVDQRTSQSPLRKQQNLHIQCM
jgi:hypothetical protein